MLDTCVVLDALMARQPFAQASEAVLLAVAERQFDGFLAAKTVLDIYYLYHRATHSDEETRQKLKILCKQLTVVDTSATDCWRALLSPLRDYEDAVLAETARAADMDFIVTRNLKDFKNSPVPACGPLEFLAKLE